MAAHSHIASTFLQRAQKFTFFGNILHFLSFGPFVGAKRFVDIVGLIMEKILQT